MSVQTVYDDKRIIYVAGGCFWGVEAYFKQVQGIITTEVGYANGKTEKPTYEQVCNDNTGHVEAVKLEYNHYIISLEEILLHALRIIDPYAINKQGGDVGEQYRTGIYYIDEGDKARIEGLFSYVDPEGKFAIEVKPLEQFFGAEEYHQDYLAKNPNGYCHVPLYKVNDPLVELPVYKSEDNRTLKERIGEQAYAITQESHTEAPFTGEYEDNFERGIYVDIVSGEPLFMSAHKYKSGCGWPAFARPIVADAVAYKEDNSISGMPRVEVHSANVGSHLGHVFTDGKAELGGLRYCINSKSLRFIKVEHMAAAGYGAWIPLLEAAEEESHT